MSPAMWGVAAAVPAVVLEYLYRVLPGSWFHYMWAFAPLQLFLSYCICQLVRAPGATLLDAFIVWALCTTGMRVAISVLMLGESIKGGTWFALALIILARVAQTTWGR